MDEKGGIENEDVGALTNEQQSKLNEFKVGSPVFPVPEARLGVYV